MNTLGPDRSASGSEDSSTYIPGSIQEGAWLIHRGFTPRAYSLGPDGFHVRVEFRDSPALQMELRHWNGAEGRPFREFSQAIDDLFRRVKAVRGGR